MAIEFKDGKGRLFGGLPCGNTSPMLASLKRSE